MCFVDHFFTFWRCNVWFLGVFNIWPQLWALFSSFFGFFSVTGGLCERKMSEQDEQILSCFYLLKQQNASKKQQAAQLQHERMTHKRFDKSPLRWGEAGRYWKINNQSVKNICLFMCSSWLASCTDAFRFTGRTTQSSPPTHLNKETKTRKSAKKLYISPL